MSEKTYVLRGSPASDSNGSGEVTDNPAKDSMHEGIASNLKAKILTPQDRFADGQLVYGFTTPKRKNALISAAMESSYQSKSGGKKSNYAGADSSKKARRFSSSARKMESHVLCKTNNVIRDEAVVTNKQSLDESVGKYVLRKRETVNTRVVQELINLRPDAGSDTESNDDLGSDEDNHVSSVATGKETRALGNALEEYFYIHSGKSGGITSDNTLTALISPRMGQKELMQHLRDTEGRHVTEVMKLQDSHERLFPIWMFEMKFGFNIIVFGLGSKRCILEKFRLKYLVEMSNASHVLINGFFPSLTMKDVLNTITDDLLNSERSFRSITEQCEFIKKKFSYPGGSELYLVIHNIDGPMLRSQKSQVALACLASASYIHIIASIDHINAPLLWDQPCLSALNWLWNDCTTFDSYTEETSYENSLLVKQSGTLALSSLTHVLRSLTPNAKGIFNLLVMYQLENGEDDSYSGMSFTDLYNRCREHFLVNSDLTLRAQLTEFRDHKLIKSKKLDGVEYLVIPLSSSTLKQFVEEK